MVEHRANGNLSMWPYRTVKCGLEYRSGTYLQNNRLEIVSSFVCTPPTPRPYANAAHATH